MASKKVVTAPSKGAPAGRTFSGESTGAPAVGKTFSGESRSAKPGSSPIVKKFFGGKR